MKQDFTALVVGSFFLLGALLLWVGWIALPVHIGTFFTTGDFATVHEQLTLWIWMYRLHIFGFVISVMALVALAGALPGAESRVLVWPAAAVLAAGLMVGALAEAFYYHHGAWGALQTAGYSGARLARHVEALRVDTEYVTCLVRFSRVFFGLGQVVLAVSLLRRPLVPGPLGVFGGLLGLAAMGLTMGLPDDLHFYTPLFHLNCLWLLGVGVSVLRSGLGGANP